MAYEIADERRWDFSPKRVRQLSRMAIDFILAV